MKATARLYLDTARLGQMRRSSQLAVRDFAKLSGEVALTLYGTNFLADGIDALPRALARRFPGLHSWRGMDGVQQDLLTLFGVSSQRHCLLASRSLHLVRAGAELLSRACRRVFLPDLNWSPYVTEVQRVLRSRGRTTVRRPFREQVFAEAWTEQELMQYMEKAFRTAACDGVLLPATTHDGIRLPVDPLLNRLRKLGCRFAIVDACQHLGHVPGSCGAEAADLVIAGVHKWMRAGLPLGVAIASDNVRDSLLTLCRDDPLFAFTTPESDAASVMETVNVWPLLACAAAVSSALDARSNVATRFQQRLANVEAFSQTLSPCNWRPLSTHLTLQSGILLLRYAGRQSSPDAARWRNLLAQRQIDVSSLDDNTLRLSLPAHPLTASQLARLGRLLRDELTA
jgi:selenocysteine lyase/cysteine desulfurase